MSLVDNVGATAVHYAAQPQQPQQQQQQQDSQSQAPAGDGQEDQQVPSPTLQKLLNSGVNADLRDEDGRTPLMWAATSGNCQPRKTWWCICDHNAGKKLVRFL